MRKYIILLLLCGFVGNAQYNLFARQNFAYKAVSNGTNTEIGGVASTISTPALLSAKLGILESRITNFTIVGSDIKCKITGSYTIPVNAFVTPSTLTYYIDSDFLITSILDNGFYGNYNFVGKDVDFQNCLTLGSQALGRINANRFLLANATTTSGNAFYESSIANVFYIPKVTDLGGSPLNNNVFTAIKSGAYIYAHPSLATNNAGGVDGDLAYATSSRQAIVRYVTSYTAPSEITDLSIGTVYRIAMQLNFTPPSSANAIDYYEVWINGNYSGKRITSSGEFITGLNPSTSYTIKLIARDIYYNGSSSNSVIQSTNTTNPAYPTGGLISYYKLDETTGTVANDSFGTQHLANTSVLINQTGKVATAYKTTASTQKLQTTTATPITGNFSLNAWVYVPSAQTNYATPIEIGNFGTNAGFGFLFSFDNTISWRINQTYNNYNQSISYGVWNMITMVYNGANVKFYVNGVLTSTVAHTTNPNTTQLRTAFYRQDQAQQAICSGDEISIHNTALTQTDIDLIHNSGIGTTL